MKTFAIIIVIVLVGCQSEYTPITSQMPSGFEFLGLGAQKEYIFKKLELPSDAEKVGISDIFSKKLSDKRFDEVRVYFKANRLEAAEFIVRLDMCREGTYLGILDALNKKLGCSAELCTDCEEHERADWKRCLPRPGDREANKVHVTWWRPECQIIVYVGTDAADNWVLKGDPVNM